ncbi:McrB family protein [Marinobacterium aestuariivivens]|uniref:McrB family protein n=1 Tax=Marinobacterium aestuariivivens TaxID=1698799 RepID=A0ABW1ZZZ2_9GAMM
MMLKWLRDFDLLQADNIGVYSLTDAGSSWAELIHWQPECLPGKDSIEIPEVPVNKSAISLDELNQNALIESVTQETAFPEHIVSQLHIGLWAHPRRHFAILAGLSGSGKTLLAKRYGEALAAQYTEAPAQNLFIQAVQPGWYDPTPLFGYINPLQPDNYVRPPLLDFLLSAAQHPDQPFTVILDEMNLSHPEQYFAPVLSAMESGDRLRLHNEGDAFDGVPDTIAYPANVAFIGTVNMDETTHGLSDKVLDRAFTLEFWDIDLDSYPNWAAHGLETEHVKRAQGCLQALAKVLSPMRLHFGWRTVEDVLTYLSLASKSNGYDFSVMLDDVVYARVLPKLRGSESARLHDTLQQAMAVLEEHGLSRSRAKVASLRNDLTETGMMRFWR